MGLDAHEAQRVVDHGLRGVHSGPLDLPALTILPALLEKGALLRVHDPQGMPEARKMLPEGIMYVGSAYEAVQDADCVILIAALGNRVRGSRRSR